MSPAFLEQRRFFEERGYLHLQGAVSPAQLRPVRDRIVSELRRSGITASGSGLPASIRSLPAFQQIGKLSRLLNLPDLAAKIISPKVQAAVHALAETSAFSTQSQLLISPPNQGAWRLEGLNWHTDLSDAESERTPGIQAFVLVDNVEKQGGGTLILAGSHLRSRNRAAEQRLRQALRDARQNAPELRELSIIELCGGVGDVYLMDMRVLHTPSINATKRWRMVGAIRFLLR